MSLDVYLSEVTEYRVYEANITHNLNKMADAAGMYQALWHPEEIGITKAAQLIPFLKIGIEQMEADPEKFKALDAENGWGTYEDFLPWLKKYLQACEEYPEAKVSVWR